MTKGQICGGIPPELEADYLFLHNLGYKDAEIVREGVRLYAAKKRAEKAAEALACPAM